jgi:hypothetical protein
MRAVATIPVGGSATPPVGGSATPQVVPLPIRFIPLPPTTKEQLQRIREGQRSRIANRVIWFYLTMVVLNITMPFILYLIPRPSNGMTFSDIRDMIFAVSAGLSSLVGILGFIVGYYFKAGESVEPAGSPPDQ